MRPLKEDTYNKARYSILEELLSFPSIRPKDWDTDTNDVREGDLVSINCGTSNQWYLSWVRKVNTNHSYLLQSLETGELCNWSNIGLNVYNRERIAERPTWKWTDRQFKFYHMWNRSCRREGAYMLLPRLPKFEEGYKVTLDVRVRFAITEFSYPKTFDDWYKIKSRDLRAYYREAEELYQKALTEKREQREHLSNQSPA